jgi:hypothetical protein
MEEDEVRYHVCIILKPMTYQKVGKAVHDNSQTLL